MRTSAQSIGLGLPLSPGARATVAGIILSASMSAHALTLIPPPTPKPLMPSVSSQPSGTYMGVLGNTHLTFQWQHGAPTIQPYAPTSQFMLCLYEASSTTGCAWPGRWAGAPASFPRTPYGTFGYSYTSLRTIPDALLDKDLYWSVGACQYNASPNNCSVGAARPLYFSTRNLRASNIDIVVGNGKSGTGNVFGSVTVVNGGTTASAATTLEMQVIEVISFGGTCSRDLSLASPAFASVILTNGERVFPSEVPAGANVKAIMKPNGRGVALTFPLALLAPGGNTTVGGMPGSPAAYSLSFNWRAGETEAMFVVRGVADTGDVVREFDETDNARAECQPFFR